MKTSQVMLILLSTLMAQICPAQDNTGPQLPGSESHVYKTVGDVQLKMWVYSPENHQHNSDRRPAIVFFFGGGWKAGSPAQFESHCRYLASRGLVAATADYRVASRHGVKADVCVEDAKSAVRWLRANAATLGIDPQRIAAAGGSAGGHTACCTALIPGFDAESEDPRISSTPNALALFNPAVMIAPLDGFATSGLTDETFADIASRTGVAAELISPIHHVRSNLPPTIIFHGIDDPTVPFSTVAEFTSRMVAAGNRCELKGFAKAAHGFFNPPRAAGSGQDDQRLHWHKRTVLQLDQFLHSLNWIDNQPTVHTVDRDFVYLRGHLNNSLRKFAVDKTGNVAFLGGSITEMDGYRPRIADWLQKQFPETEFTFTNAGLASTCSHTGAFRLERDVLSKGPVDLLFVEFAVNDDQDAGHSAEDCLRGMEGVIRHTRQTYPFADIVMTHFVNEGMLKTLHQGDTILSARQHERVATHYNVSSVYLSKVLNSLIENEQMTWKQFGGTHPGPMGNQLAADMATAILSSAWRAVDPASIQPMAHPLPQQTLIDSCFSSGRLVTAEEITPGDGWKLSIPDWDNIKGSKRAGYLTAPLLHSEKPLSSQDFQFTGNAIGAFVLAGPDAGQLEVSVDDGDWKIVELYHRISKGIHYPRKVMFAPDL